MKKYISLARAVERSSYSAVEWSKLAKRGVIDAREHEDGWYINEAELDRTFDATYFNELTRSPLRTPGRPMQSALVGVLLILGLAVTMASWQASDLLPKLATGDFSSRQGLAAVAVSMVATSTPTSTPVATSDPITVSSNNSWWSAWQSLLETLAYLQERVTTNWENFLGLSTSPPVIESPATTGGLATSTTQLQRLIDQRVNLTIQSLLKNPASSQGSGGSASGVVVVPTSGNAASDQIIRERLQSAFSDTIRIQFDRSGETGIITPVFQKLPNDNYLFLVTPLRPR